MNLERTVLVTRDAGQEGRARLSARPRRKESKASCVEQGHDETPSATPRLEEFGAGWMCLTDCEELEALDTARAGGGGTVSTARCRIRSRS